MKNNWYIIKRLLSDEKYLVDNLVPIECFSIASIMESLNNDVKSTDSFYLVKLEISILTFCFGYRKNKELIPYIIELEKIMILDFTVGAIPKCRNLFDDMYRQYAIKYLNNVTAMIVRL